MPGRWNSLRTEHPVLARNDKVNPAAGISDRVWLWAHLTTLTATTFLVSIAEFPAAGRLRPER
jgi:hypothetical protein